MARALEITGTLPGAAAPALHAWVRAGETLRWTRDPAAMAGRPSASGEGALLGPPSTCAGDPLVVGVAPDAPGWMVHVPAGGSLVDAEGACLGVGPLAARLTRGRVRLLLDDYTYDVRVVEGSVVLPRVRAVGVRECVAVIGLLAPAAAAWAGHGADREEPASIEELLVELREEASRAAPEFRSVELAPPPAPSPEPVHPAAPAPNPDRARVTPTLAHPADAPGARDPVLVLPDVDADAPCGPGGDGPVCMPWDRRGDVSDDSALAAALASPAPEGIRVGELDGALIAQMLRKRLDVGVLDVPPARGHAARVHRPHADGALTGLPLARVWTDMARAAGGCVRTEAWWTATVVAEVDAEGNLVRVDVAGEHAACVSRALGRVRVLPDDRRVPARPVGPGRLRFTLSAREW